MVSKLSFFLKSWIQTLLLVCSPTYWVQLLVQRRYFFWIALLLERICQFWQLNFIFPSDPLQKTKQADFFYFLSWAYWIRSSWHLKQSFMNTLHNLKWSVLVHVLHILIVPCLALWVIVTRWDSDPIHLQVSIFLIYSQLPLQDQALLPNGVICPQIASPFIIAYNNYLRVMVSMVWPNVALEAWFKW